jgi:hypothetical protein
MVLISDSKEEGMESLVTQIGTAEGPVMNNATKASTTAYGC